MSASAWRGIGVPASYVLGFPMGLGGQGIWLGMALGLSVAAVTMMARFWRGPAMALRALVPGVPPPDATPGGKV